MFEEIIREDEYHNWFLSLTEFERDAWRRIVDFAEGYGMDERQAFSNKKMMSNAFWCSVGC